MLLNQPPPILDLSVYDRAFANSRINILQDQQWIILLVIVAELQLTTMVKLGCDGNKLCIFFILILFTP
jgi:hypothetical protein